MAKKSMIVKNQQRKRKIELFRTRRKVLKETSEDTKLSMVKRVTAMIKLSELPRNSSRVRYRNRCALTGRPRAYHGEFGISRIMLKELASWGKIPGLKKSSW
jgi:small subunit ribosomal protein S14